MKYESKYSIGYNLNDRDSILCLMFDGGLKIVWTKLK